MLCGTLPAGLTVFIRLFVPESDRWERGRRAGVTSHWRTGDLGGVLVGAAAALGLIALWAADVPWLGRLAASPLLLAVVAWGYLTPMRGFLKRAVAPAERRSVLRTMLLAAALSGVALLGTWGTAQFAPTWAYKELTARNRPRSPRVDADGVGRRGVRRLRRRGRARRPVRPTDHLCRAVPGVARRRGRVLPIELGLRRCFSWRRRSPSGR